MLCVSMSFDLSYTRNDTIPNMYSGDKYGQVDFVTWLKCTSM